jgi:RNA ligase (TIGR02306 family)
MSKVSVEYVNVYSHSNADFLELVNIGNYQYTVEKGLYKTGDKGVAVPKGFLLTHPVMLREWSKYLGGPNNNLVRSMVQRLQESQGIVIPQVVLQEMGFNIDDFEVGRDVSSVLGIEKYIPPIPPDLVDKIERFDGLTWPDHHDCLFPSVYKSRFVEDEPITITSKIHGEQVNYVLLPSDEQVYVSTKGLLHDGFVFKQEVNNKYVRAWNDFVNTNNLYLIKSVCCIDFNPNTAQIQFVCELTNTQKGFNYGFDKPTLLIYKVLVNGKSIDLCLLRRHTVNVVPLLYTGVYNNESLAMAEELAAIEECPLHPSTLNEGVVLSNGKYYMKFKNGGFIKKYDARL